MASRQGNRLLTLARTMVASIERSRIADAAAFACFCVGRCRLYVVVRDGPAPVFLCWSRLRRGIRFGDRGASGSSRR
jgi:hypothetical protein